MVLLASEFMTVPWLAVCWQIIPRMQNLNELEYFLKKHISLQANAILSGFNWNSAITNYTPTKPIKENQIRTNRSPATLFHIYSFLGACSIWYIWDNNDKPLCHCFCKGTLKSPVFFYKNFINHEQLKSFQNPYLELEKNQLTKLREVKINGISVVYCLLFASSLTD